MFRSKRRPMPGHYYVAVSDKRKKQVLARCRMKLRNRTASPADMAVLWEERENPEWPMFRSVFRIRHPDALDGTKGALKEAWSYVMVCRSRLRPVRKKPTALQPMKAGGGRG